MRLNCESLSIVNAAVAGLVRLYSEKPTVDEGYLDAFSKASNLFMRVRHEDGSRWLVVSNSHSGIRAIWINLGAYAPEVQPTNPSGAGAPSELAETLRKTA